MTKPKHSNYRCIAERTIKCDDEECTTPATPEASHRGTSTAPPAVAATSLRVAAVSSRNLKAPAAKQQEHAESTAGSTALAKNMEKFADKEAKKAKECHTLATPESWKNAIEKETEQAAAIESAIEKFKSSELKEMIKQELTRDIIKNERQACLTFYTATTTQLDPEDRISLKIKGIPCSVKTTIWEIVNKHIPDKWFTNSTRITSSMLEDGVNTPGIFGGELDKIKDTRLVETIKQFSEDGLKVFKKVQDEHRKWIAGRIEKDRGVVIYTTTITGTEEEEDQRFLSITTDSNKQIWTDVHARIKESNEDLQKQIDRFIEGNKPSWIKLGLERHKQFDIIHIPYDTVIQTQCDDARTIRDFKRFNSLIKAIAWVNQYNREQKEINGLKILVASPEDFKHAAWMSRDAFQQTLSKLDTRSKEVIAAVNELMNDNKWETIDDAPGYVWVKRPLLQKKLGIRTADTIREYTETLSNLGYLALHQARGGSRTYVAIENEYKCEEGNHPLFKLPVDQQHDRILEYLKDKENLPPTAPTNNLRTTTMRKKQKNRRCRR